jgi:hypothetical protein
MAAREECRMLGPGAARALAVIEAFLAESAGTSAR